MPQLTMPTTNHLSGSRSSWQRRGPPESPCCTPKVIVENSQFGELLFLYLVFPPFVIKPRERGTAYETQLGISMEDSTRSKTSVLNCTSSIAFEVSVFIFSSLRTVFSLFVQNEWKCDRSFSLTSWICSPRILIWTTRRMVRAEKGDFARSRNWSTLKLSFWNWSSLPWRCRTYKA